MRKIIINYSFAQIESGCMFRLGFFFFLTTSHKLSSLDGKVAGKIANGFNTVVILKVLADC